MKRRRAWPALVVLGGFVFLALFAELIASEAPLAVRLDGQTYWLPAFSHPPALHAQTQQSLRPRAEWMLSTPVPFGPNQTFTEFSVDAGPPPWAPDGRHWLGTDELGRDVLARIIHGARVSLFVGFASVALCLVLGVLLGALAGWKGGATDAVISRLTELMMTFPTLFFLLAVLGALRVSSLWPLVLAIAITRWTDPARLIRAEVLKLKQLDFVLAIRALGASQGRLLFRHLLPNALPPVLAQAAFAVATAILLESATSFLGLGAPPPTASWGELLTQAHRYITYPGAWWLAVFPGLCLFATVLSLNRLGEALQSRLDSRG